jgi:uncharacterized membrane protein YeaQ/YmgE (transglycosylase-associated protein family)
MSCQGLLHFFVGWLGAWLGSPVLGYWWEGLNYGQGYFIPAILGCLEPLVPTVDLVKSWERVYKE